MPSAVNLALINFFVGDIQGGLGPFLATWLASAAQWDAGRIGLVTTLVGLATLALSGPLGALVDALHRPKMLLAVACLAILAGTMALLPARSFSAVLVAQFVAALGGTLLIPALTALTLGIVGKKGFPTQQGRNQAFNHLGVVAAALLITWGTSRAGAQTSFWVLGVMAVFALICVMATPEARWNKRRAIGWKEDEPPETTHRDSLKTVFTNGRLFSLSIALALFNLSNGPMLALLGQKLVSTGADATGWTATYVLVAQLTMVPVALGAGLIADRRGRRMLLIAATAVLPVRALICAFVNDPVLLIGAEILDGVASGIIGVAVPVVVADLTWGSGRTQAALGTVNGVQGIGGALSGLVGGYLVTLFGWTTAFVALGIPALAALGVLFWLEETRGSADEPRAAKEEAKEKAEEAERDAGVPAAAHA